jgi:hypothetical protein
MERQQSSMLPPQIEKSPRWGQTWKPLLQRRQSAGAATAVLRKVAADGRSKPQRSQGAKYRICPAPWQTERWDAAPGLNAHNPGSQAHAHPAPEGGFLKATAARGIAGRETRSPTPPSRSAAPRQALHPRMALTRQPRHVAASQLQPAPVQSASEPSAGRPAASDGRSAGQDPPLRGSDGRRAAGQPPRRAGRWRMRA